VRYFDPEKRRAGIPDEVAALVEGMTDTTTTLSLVNISPVEGRKLIVQAGAYGEHQVTSVEHDGETYVIDQLHFTVNLGPGAGSKLMIHHQRYANQPTLAHP
jgi:hypothetical protein